MNIAIVGAGILGSIFDLLPVKIKNVFCKADEAVP